MASVSNNKQIKQKKLWKSIHLAKNVFVLMSVAAQIPPKQFVAFMQKPFLFFIKNIIWYILHAFYTNAVDIFCWNIMQSLIYCSY